VAVLVLLMVMLASVVWKPVNRTLASREADSCFQNEDYQGAAEAYQRALDNGAERSTTLPLMKLAEGAHLVQLAREARASEDYQAVRSNASGAQRRFAGIDKQALPETFVSVLDERTVSSESLLDYADAMDAMQDGDYSTAIAGLESAVQGDDDPVYTAALDKAKRLLLEQQIAVSKAHYDAGVAAMGSGDFETAIEEFEQVLEVDEERYALVEDRIQEARAGWANALVAEAKKAIANEDYQRAVDAARHAASMGIKGTGAKEVLAQARQLEEEAAVAAREAEQLAEAAKMEDADYLFGEYWMEGSMACKPVIESLVLYDYEWTDGLFGLKFPRYVGNVKAPGVLTLVGDSLRVQNAFGVWRSSVTYWCDYDVNRGVVLDAGAE
jgi:tetratricopeptide (TPR) repeat protein